MPVKKPSGLRLLPLFLWALFIRGVSQLPILSRRQSNRLSRSSLKRLHRFIAKLEDVADNRSGGTQGPQAIVVPPQRTRHEKPLNYDLEPYQSAHRILLVCHHAPTVNHAGGLRILDMLRMIKTRLPNVYIEVFTPADKKLYGPLVEASQIADKITLAEHYNFSLREFKDRRQGQIPYFDVVDFQFPQPLEVVQQYRKIGARLIFTPMESLIRNELIGRGETGDQKAALKNPDAILEQQIAHEVDQTICVSEMDCAAVAGFVDTAVTAIETGVSEIEFSENMEKHDMPPLTVCYVAYFGSETNRVALKWYLDNVHPRVLAAVPDYNFAIIGRGDVSDLIDPLPMGVDYVGEVERIGPYLKGSTVGIAPALSGSGFRGKINQYACLGLPTVASPLSANGLAYEDGVSIFVAKEPERFAQCIVQLLEDTPLRARMAAKAQNVAQLHYSWDSKWPAIAKAYDLPETPGLPSEPSVHAVVPSYQHAGFIEERLRSIFNQEYAQIRVTVIDDHSTDDSDSVIRALQKEFDFTYIRRDENSGTPFSAWEYAANNTEEDLIWICESDDAADPMLVANLVKQMGTRPTTKIGYCASQVVDEAGQLLDTTASFHKQVFDPFRWQFPFIARGRQELQRYARFGMPVPNMSSALFDRDVFKKAFTPNIRDYRLAGDWLFLGQALQYGDIVFVPELLNRFRQHAQTSRRRTKEVRKIAEYASVRQILTHLSDPSDTAYLDAVKHDLNALVADMDLVQPVLEEFFDLDPEGARMFSDMIDAHLDNGVASEELTHLLALGAPLPISDTA